MTTTATTTADAIKFELDTMARRVVEAHAAIGQVTPGTHATVEQLEWVIKAQAMHTAWAWAWDVYRTRTQAGATPEEALAAALDQMRRSAMHTRIGSSTSPVSNWQDVMLLEAYRKVVRDLESMGR